MTDAWDPVQYRRFAAERRQPFDDLRSMCLPVVNGRIVDLGCGTGELTAELHRGLRALETVGVDRSEAMLAEAARWAKEVPGLRFELGDLAEWQGSGVDLVFANASLHWAPDHPNLLARLRFSLATGGQLAFQVPASFAHPSHVLAAEVATEPEFADLGAAVMAPGEAVLSPSRYAEILHSLGAVQQSARLQVYGHLMPSVEAVVEWVRGTLLTPIRARLDDATFEAYLSRYRERLLAELGQQRPYFYAFSRILCWARFP
ncbi:MAG: methyltransferase domain-containing protein [Acidimicrobiales bacterium]